MKYGTGGGAPRGVKGKALSSLQRVELEVPKPWRHFQRDPEPSGGVLARRAFWLHLCRRTKVEYMNQSPIILELGLFYVIAIYYKICYNTIK